MKFQTLVTLVSFTFAIGLWFGSTHSLPLNEASSTDSAEVVNSSTAKMKLGAFSISLAVKDIKASKAFYEKLDFVEAGGNIKHNWLIMRNGTTTIGLFQGMFEKNIMTFNPGWDQNAKPVKDFVDVRELQAEFKSRDMKLEKEAKADSKGPASFVLKDPDGNMILFDQHVSKPKK